MIKHAGETFNKAWLKTVTEETAVRTLQGYDHNTIRNVWKQANGLSKPNYVVKDEKPKRKRKEKED
jgi:dsRNA-specific ribonuclease